MSSLLKFRWHKDAPQSGSNPNLMGQPLSSLPSSGAGTPGSGNSPTSSPGAGKGKKGKGRPPPLAHQRPMNRSFSWCESMSPHYADRPAFFPHPPPTDRLGFTSRETDAVQDVILLAKKQAKTVKVLNGDLYIDYKYHGPLPDGCRV